MINYPMLAAQVLNQPLMLEPGYARIFFAALAPRLGAQLLVDAQGETFGVDAMQAEADSFFHPVTGEARHYRIENGVAVLPISGALAHKTGNVRPRSGLQGYDGIHRMREQALSDPDVKGILLDIHSPGGQVAGAFDESDAIYHARSHKPIWALANDSCTSAAQLIACAASRRFITQTGIAGSIGVIAAHSNHQQALERVGIAITLLTAGQHKADGNPYQALPDAVAAKWQAKLDANRQLFAQKVAQYTGLSLQAVLDTEAATYQGQEAVDCGLADALINANDAVSIMADYVNHQKVYAMSDTTPNPSAEAGANPESQASTPTSPEPTTPSTNLGANTDAQVVDAAALISACEKAGMLSQVGQLAKQSLTPEALDNQLNQLAELRDVLAAASLSDQFDAMAAQLSNPVALVRTALAHSSAHGEESETHPARPVSASAEKQPSHQKAYASPASL